MQKVKSIYNIPNLITISRIVLLPLMAILIYRNHNYSAVAVLIFIGLTDFFDGWLARRMKQETRVGRLMDPIADKLFLTVAIIFLCARGPGGDPHINPWLASLILAREFLVSGFRSLAASKNMEIKSISIAKWKTTFQFVGLGFIFANKHLFNLSTIHIGNVILWISVILSYSSMAIYMIRLFTLYKEED